MSENGRQDHENERQGLENFVLHATASTGNDLARNFAFKRVFLLDGCLIPDFRIPVNSRLIGEREWPIRASEAPVQARPVAIQGWIPAPDAKHPLKANAGVKLSILSQSFGSLDIEDHCPDCLFRSTKTNKEILRM